MAQSIMSSLDVVYSLSTAKDNLQQLFKANVKKKKCELCGKEFENLLEFEYLDNSKPPHPDNFETTTACSVLCVKKHKNCNICVPLEVRKDTLARKGYLFVRNQIRK